MDDTLKEDIRDYYYPEYVKQVKSEKTGFFKWLDDVNDKFDNATSKIGLNGPGVTLLASVVTAVWVPPVGLPMLGLWFADMVGTIYSAAQDGKEAVKRLDADIENGKLPELYGAVLDTQIRELTEQKSQLPIKGTAVGAFDKAQEPKEAAPAAPAPAPATNYFPSIH